MKRFIWMILLIGAAHAQTIITPKDLSPAGPQTGNEAIAEDQGTCVGCTVKTSPAQLAAYEASLAETFTYKTLGNGTVFNFTTPAMAIAGPPPAAYSANIINITDNTLSGVMGLSIVTHSGNPSASGNGTAAFGGFDIMDTAQTGNTNGLGIWGWCEAAVSMPSGVHSCFGMNAQARVDAGVTGVTGLIGAENDVSIQTGGAALDVFGTTSVKVGDDTAHGSRNEAAFAALSGAATGWNNGLQFTNYGGHPAISTAGTLLSTKGSATVLSFLDFSSYACSGGYEINFTGLTADCSGNVVANSINNTPLGNGTASSAAVTSLNAQTENVKASGSTGNSVLSLQTNGATSASGDEITFFSQTTQEFIVGMYQGSPITWYLFDQVGAKNMIVAQSNGGLQLMPVSGAVTVGTAAAGATGSITAQSVGTSGYAISGLPTCNSGSQGQTAYVTNGVASPTYLGTVSTTGSTVAPVFCNGTSWVYH